MTMTMMMMMMMVKRKKQRWKRRKEKKKKKKIDYYYTLLCIILYDIVSCYVVLYCIILRYNYCVIMHFKLVTIFCTIIMHQYMHAFIIGEVQTPNASTSLQPTSVRMFSTSAPFIFSPFSSRKQSV